MLTLQKYLGNVQRNLGRSVARLRSRHFMAQRANLQRRAKLALFGYYQYPSLVKLRYDAWN